MIDLFNVLTKLSNFNLIKYTEHYVITIDTGGGKPVLLEAESLDSLAKLLRGYCEERGLYNEY